MENCYSNRSKQPQRKASRLKLVAKNKERERKKEGK